MTVRSLARRVAAFHHQADGNERIAAFGRFKAVARNIRDVFEQAAPLAGRAVSAVVFARARALTEEALARHRDLIDARAARGVPRDCHGDLHLDHVYHFPDRPPPGDLVIIDCIEFNERFRFIDPVADMAFAAMDFAFRGRRDLAGTFADAYFDASCDLEGRELLPLYTAYRAAVRGLVDELLLAEPEVPADERDRAARRARAHWLLALAELEEPDRRPCLVLVGGLPGTGKSVLAAGLADRAGFRVVRSDVVRKELANLPSCAPSPPEVKEWLYSSEWTERTYAECLRCAEQLLVTGGRVIVDATFRDEERRRRFLEAAIGLGVPAVILICEARPETVRARLARRRGSASDADWRVYQQVAADWEGMGNATQPYWRTVSTQGSQESALVAAVDVLRRERLLGPGVGESPAS